MGGNQNPYEQYIQNFAPSKDGGAGSGYAGNTPGGGYPPMPQGGYPGQQAGGYPPMPPQQGYGQQNYSSNQSSSYSGGGGSYGKPNFLVQQLR